MNTSTPPFNLPATTPELALRLGLVLAGLVALVARRFVRVPRLTGLTVLLCGRIGRAVWRFARLLMRPAKVRAPGVRAGRAGGDRARGLALPRGRGWLVRELGWEAAGCASQLQALLDDPAMQAVVARFPEAGRILRPLCRMLGVPGPAVPEVAVVDAAETPAAARVWPRLARPGLPGVVGDCPIFAKPA